MGESARRSGNGVKFVTRRKRKRGFASRPPPSCRRPKIARFSRRQNQLEVNKRDNNGRKKASGSSYYDKIVDPLVHCRSILDSIPGVYTPPNRTDYGNFLKPMAWMKRWKRTG